MRERGEDEEDVQRVESEREREESEEREERTHSIYHTMQTVGGVQAYSDTVGGDTLEAKCMQHRARRGLPLFFRFIWSELYFRFIWFVCALYSFICALFGLCLVRASTILSLHLV
jgi:hypothetical protein